MTPRAWGTRRAKASAVHEGLHRAYEASARRAPSPIDGPAGRCLRQSILRYTHYPMCATSALDWAMYTSGFTHVGCFDWRRHLRRKHGVQRSLAIERTRLRVSWTGASLPLHPRLFRLGHRRVHVTFELPRGGRPENVIPVVVGFAGQHEPAGSTAAVNG